MAPLLGDGADGVSGAAGATGTVEPTNGRTRRRQGVKGDVVGTGRYSKETISAMKLWSVIDPVATVCVK